MKTKNNKRILAWVLSICMAIALLPAMPAEYAQAADGDLVYNFTGMLDSAYVDASASSTDPWGHMAATSNAYSPTNLSKALTFAYTQAKSSAPWCVADVYSYDRKAQSATNVKLYANTGIYAYAYGNATARIARAGVLLKVNEGEEGWYRVKPSYKFSTAGNGVATMSLYDKGTFTGDEIPVNAIFTPDESKLLSTVAANMTAGKFVSADMGIRYLTAGDYYFRIQCQAVTGASGQHNIWVENVTFEKVDFSIVPSAASAELAEGESKDITLALNEAGVAYSGNVTYSAEVAGNVATATVENNTLTVKGASAGEATVTVTAKVDGNTAATLNIPVTVTKPVHPTFGTSYAYIRENYDGEKTTYKLILIAAVDSLDYTKVGFNYTIGEAEEKSIEETAAYKTLTFNGASLTADNLGGAESGYLFYSEIDLTADEAASAIEFKAYADEEVGGTYRIDTAYYTAQ